MCHVRPGVAKIGWGDPPASTNNSPPFRAALMSPAPGRGGEQRKPHPGWGQQGKRWHRPGPMDGGVFGGAGPVPPPHWSWGAALGAPVGGEQETSAPSAVPTGGGSQGCSCPPRSVTLSPALSPAREQLRRSRHSRTFLVEAGVGELWAEMQAGTDKIKDGFRLVSPGGGAAQGPRPRVPASPSPRAGVPGSAWGHPAAGTHAGPQWPPSPPQVTGTSWRTAGGAPWT